MMNQAHEKIRIRLPADRFELNDLDEKDISKMGLECSEDDPDQVWLSATPAHLIQHLFATLFQVDQITADVMRSAELATLIHKAKLMDLNDRISALEKSAGIDRQTAAGDLNGAISGLSGMPTKDAIDKVRKHLAERNAQHQGRAKATPSDPSKQTSEDT
ncbi:hypothetical protein [Shimia thalassica]|uniref:hypothetical protein n=1 Tax=Shimia thalassica TaxID=1715693 RepID=UPI0027357AE4|nr:hypothetical protein [Shimia thalassica]MDP2520144.1 hypothetical protein [Shimia thalassica]